VKARDKKRWLTQAGAATTLSGSLAKRPAKTQASRVAFAWYREEDWWRLRELASDVHALEDSHGEWLENAERSVASLRSKGIVVEKVLVDVESAEAWSRQESRPFDSAARAGFVAAVASRDAAASAAEPRDEADRARRKR
jgi:hypothetical protein